MRNFFFYALIFTVLFLCVCNANEAQGEMPETSPNMVVLDDASIEATIKGNKKVLIEFYAPWCGYCQAFAQKYENIADRVAADPNLDVVIAKIDGDANPESMTRHKAEYFPTIILFQENDSVQYQGNLEEADLLQFLETGENPSNGGGGAGGEESGQQDEQMESKMEAPVKLNKKEELEKVLMESSVERPCLIGFFPEAMEEEYLTIMKDAGFVGVGYKYVTDKSVIEGVHDTFPSFAVFVDGLAKATLTFEEEAKLPEKKKIFKFLRANRFPLVGHVTMKNIEDYWRSEAEDNIATLYVVTESENKKLVSLLEGEAKASTKKVYVALMDANDPIYTNMLSEMGLPKNSMMITVGSNLQYMFKGKLSDEAAVKKFVADYNADALKQFTKSQPVPEKNDGPVYVVVADTFDETVGQDKDVLIEFYAPWCGHCQELEPKYNKLGEAFKGVDTLLIAKMDADGNTPPPQIQGFPTLLFYPKGSTEPIEYSGDLEAKAIAEFVKEKSTADTSGVNHDEL